MELGITRSVTFSTDRNTEIQVKGTDCKSHSDGQSGFANLSKDADKLLVGSRLRNISGLCICSGRTKQVGCTIGNEGNHLSPNSGVLNSIVIEPGWILRAVEVQQIATELKKCRDLANSVDDMEYRYRTVEDCKVLYKLKKESTQLVLPKNRGFRQLLLEELHASKLAGNLGVRKTLTALQQRVWWPGIVQTVSRFIKACPICQKVKNST